MILTIKHLVKFNKLLTISLSRTCCNSTNFLILILNEIKSINLDISDNTLIDNSLTDKLTIELKNLKSLNLSQCVINNNMIEPFKKYFQTRRN